MQDATSTLLVIKELAGHQPPRLDPIQQFIMGRIDLATDIWVAVWCTTSVILLLKLWHDYKKHRERSH